MSADDDVPDFPNVEAEARYWRCLANDLKDELEEIRASSNDLEKELDVDLEATERREAELRAVTERLKGDLDDSKARHQAALREHTNTLSHMQRELESVRQAEQTLRTRIRDMEVDNDDLEKSERAMESTLQDLESRYSRALERTALLEEELVAKARLEEEVQRFKDELRDANEELGIMRSQRASLPPAPERPLTPPGSQSELPPLPPAAEEAGSPFRRPHGSLESETTPRKLADVRPASIVRSSTAVNLAFSRIPSSVSPQRRISTHITPSPSPVPLGQSLSRADPTIFAPKSSTAPRAAALATRRTGAAVSEFNATKARILQARTERRTALPVSSSIPRVRRTSIAPSATPPVPPFASTSARSTSGFPLSANRQSLAASQVTPSGSRPNRAMRHNEGDSPDSSPLAAAVPRRPPSRLSAVSTSSSSRPATPSGIPTLRSPTPSGGMYASMRPPSSLGQNRRKSLAPSSTATPTRTGFGSAVPPRPHLSSNGRPRSVGEGLTLGASTTARRYSLKGSVAPAPGTPPPPVPKLTRS